MTDGGKTVGGVGGIGGIGGSTQRTQPADPVGVGGKKAAVAGGTAATVGAGSQVAFLTMILTWLKGLWAMMAAMAMNLLQMIFAFVLFLVSKAVGFFGMIGAGIATATNAVAGFFGMGAQVVGTAAVSIANVAVGAGVSVAVVASVFTGVNLTTGAQETARADALLVDCSVELAAALEDSGEPTPGSETMMANAQTIYSVFSAWGMPDENIAGILGNWEQESGMDPTRVQNTANTPYTVSDAEQAGAENTDNGIGLGQWTFGRNSNLRAYADSHSASWGALEIQLGFMISPAEGGNATVVRHMISTSLGTPGAAAVYFHDEWERSADASTATREANAERWMGLLSGWEANQELADSILAQAGTSVDGAGANSAAAARQECVDGEETVADGVLVDGGLTVEQAQAIVDLYNAEGDAFLDGRYGEYGGPGSCGTNHAENCVSLSTYFVNKYTTYQQYPWGNGIQTARTISEDTGIPLQNTPVAYSVASGPGTSSAGHTLVVVGVEGDNVIIIEAGYCAFMGRVRTMSAANMTANGWVFVNINSIMLPEGDAYAA